MSRVQCSKHAGIQPIRQQRFSTAAKVCLASYSDKLRFLPLSYQCFPLPKSLPLLLDQSQIATLDLQRTGRERGRRPRAAYKRDLHLQRRPRQTNEPPGEVSESAEGPALHSLAIYSGPARLTYKSILGLGFC